MSEFTCPRCGTKFRRTPGRMRNPLCAYCQGNRLRPEIKAKREVNRIETESKMVRMRMETSLSYTVIGRVFGYSREGARKAVVRAMRGRNV